MLNVKEEHTISMIKSLISEKEMPQIKMEEDKEEFSEQLAACIYVKDQELIIRQRESDKAKQVIQRKDAEIAALHRKVSKSNAKCRTHQTGKQIGLPSRRRLFNLVKHIDSNVQKCLEIGQISVDNNDGFEMISREDALKCSRIMKSAHEALTSLKNMRSDLVIENDVRAWEEVFERTNIDLYILG